MNAPVGSTFSLLNEMLSRRDNLQYFKHATNYKPPFVMECRMIEIS